jgi:hypothetical protein
VSVVIVPIMSFMGQWRATPAGMYSLNHRQWLPCRHDHDLLYSVMNTCIVFFFAPCCWRLLPDDQDVFPPSGSPFEGKYQTLHSCSFLAPETIRSSIRSFVVRCDVTVRVSDTLLQQVIAFEGEKEKETKKKKLSNKQAGREKTLSRTHDHIAACDLRYVFFLLLVCFPSLSIACHDTHF